MKKTLLSILSGILVMTMVNCSHSKTPSRVESPSSLEGKTVIISYQNSKVLKEVEGVKEGGWKPIKSVNDDNRNVLCTSIEPSTLSITLNFPKGKNSVYRKIGNNMGNTFTYKKLGESTGQISYQSDLDQSGVINLKFVSPTKIIGTETNRQGDYFGKVKNIQVTIQ